MNCPKCHQGVLDIDVKCPHCGAALGATGAHRMLGQVVLGTYELVDVLGQGGMSVVFKARHKMTEQEVALKILPPELAAHSQVKSRFLEEAKALAALDHPNIVHLYNFGQENGSFVLAMQFVQGRTWERMILENKRLDWPTSCRIAIDVLKALEYAHGRGVIHRDMKPSNVLVRASDGAATVMDFGIAKMTTSTKLTATGQTMGTVRYMSPEQVRGQEVDLRTDIYSLGATLYESLTGDTPFDGQTHFEIMTKHLSEPAKRPSALGIAMPREVEDALIQSLEKKAEDRFETARDMRKVLEQALKDNDVGLVETQRLGRAEVMSEAATAPQKRSARAPQTAPRAATANELADVLEPGQSDVRPRKKKSAANLALPIAGVLVAAAAATAGVMLVRGKKPTYTAHAPIKGVTLTAGKQIGKVYFETDGAITPEQLAQAYGKTLDELRAFDPKVKATYDVVVLVEAVPHAALCEPGITRASTTPCDPADVAVSSLGKGATHNLVISDDPATLAHTLRVGVAQAVCDFQPFFVDANGGDLKEICELTKRFAAAK